MQKENIFENLPLKMKESTVFHEKDITKKLYDDYFLFREILNRNLLKNNSEHDNLTLFKKSQKLLDRFLFILFAEDKGLLPYFTISKIINRFQDLKKLDAYKPLYDIYKQFFNYIDKGKKEDKIPAYNGGLFAPDEVLDNFIIDDDILEERLLTLSAYDFNTEVDVNILGHIFEHSLAYLEEKIAKLEGKSINKKKSQRKKDGVFYTPKYITQYIVENTIGKLCREKRKELGIFEIEIDDSYNSYKKNKVSLTKKGKELEKKLEMYKDYLLSLKVLDPACGSGAFLNQALEFFINEHKIIIELKKDLHKGEFSLFDITGELNKIETSILENNLYGVDINEESVEIAKLSLWLRTAKKGRKLSSLNNNIKCGNSLIDDPEVAGDKAFNWNEEFSEIMENGGFDVVIGNPPYGVEIIIENEELKESYMLFYKKSIFLLKDKGILSFITPDSWLINNNAKILREIFIKEGSISKLYDVYKAFKDAPDVWCNIPIFHKNIFLDSIKISRTFPYNQKIFQFEMKWNNIVNFGSNQWYPYINNDLTMIFNKMRKSKTLLKDYFFVKRGFSPTPNTKNITFIKTERQIIGGIDFGRYISKVTKKYLINDYTKSFQSIENIKKQNIIGIQRIRTNSLNFKSKWLISQFFNKGYIPIDSIGYFLKKENLELKFLLTVINSNLMNLYYKLHFTDKNVKPLYLKELPFKEISIENQQPFIEKANIMLELNKKLYEGKKLFLDELKLEKIPKKLQNFEELDLNEFITAYKKAKKLKFTKNENKFMTLKLKEEWKQVFEYSQKKALDLKLEINETDKEIDKMVYELYELTEEEIAVVKEQ